MLINNYGREQLLIGSILDTTMGKLQGSLPFARLLHEIKWFRLVNEWTCLANPFAQKILKNEKHEEICGAKNDNNTAAPKQENVINFFLVRSLIKT